MEIKVGEPNKELNVVAALYEMMELNQIWGECYDYDDMVCIEIEWGDWKHEHKRMDYLMEQLGFYCIEEELTEENGSDCYSSRHRYILSESEKIDHAKHEVLMGQDHCYWVYSNETDKYYETMVSWNSYDEEAFVEEFNKIGFKLYGSNWISEPEFDI